MTREDAASVLAYLMAGFPNWNPPETTQQVWVLTLERLDFDDAHTAAVEWVGTQSWPPVPAQFIERAEQARLRREWEAGAQERLDSRLACDGNGYVPGPHGLEPCPRCNPFMRERWKVGRWNDELRKADLPEDWARPTRCRPYDPTERPPTFADARRALRSGYVAELSAQGFDLDTIERRWEILQAGGSPWSTSLPRG